METKLHELQEKLAIEEADKLQLQTQLHQCLESEVNDSLLPGIPGIFKFPVSREKGSGNPRNFWCKKLAILD